MNDKPRGVWLRFNPSEQIPNDLMLVTDGERINIVYHQGTVKLENFERKDTTYYMLIPFLMKDNSLLEEDTNDHKTSY